MLKGGAIRGGGAAGKESVKVASKPSVTMQHNNVAVQWWRSPFENLY